MSRRLPLVAAAVLAVLAAALAPLGVGTASAATGGGVTLPAPAGGSVSVNSTTDLVNQTVHVSWKGFKPSSDTVVRPSSTMYVVRVYQCRGDAPTGPQDCYGSSVYTYPGQTDPTQILPDGPSNHRDAATAKDGTGSLDMEVRTALESSTLGCTATTACSLVVVPNYGDPKHHDLDFIDATNSAMDSTWAWANHVAVPLHLAPSGATCPLGLPGVTTLGSPMLARGLTSWQPAACTAADPVRIDYTALGEPDARLSYLASTGASVALTTLPAAATDAGRPTAYAPLSISGITVAFHVDDSVTGQPITALKLTPRLVAKLITESYGGVGYVAPHTKVGTGNPGTAGNPYSIWADKDFLTLNPGHSWPTVATNPLLVSGNTDLVWELTRWIDADPQARAWLDGTSDQWGMHVNTYFKGIDYPAESLETRDPYPALTYTFVPVNGLDHVARALVSDTPSSSSPTPDENGVHPKDPQELPGARNLLAIIDTADAAAFSMPTAAIRNPGGTFVQPTVAAMGAEVPLMAVDPRTGTRTADMTSTSAAAYPLTLVQYAMVPTGDLSADEVTDVTRFLSYAGGPGQVSGPTTGQLPGGYLPLTTDLTAQLTAASTAVLNQTGKPAPAAPTTTITTTPDSGSGPAAPFTTPATGTPGSTPVTGSSALPPAPAAPDGTSTTKTSQASVNRYSGTPGTSSMVRLLLPALLVLSLLAGLGGPVLLSNGGVGGLVRRIVSKVTT